jgi:hypothetical protein
MILLAASAAACAPSAQPAASAPRPAPSPAAARAQVPPVLGLLSERERLSLSAAQVAALDSIAREWEVADTRLNRQLGAARGSRPPAFTLALRPGAGPALLAIAENNHRAAAAVEQVLTPGQRQSVCALPPSTRAPSATRMQAGRPWPWCQPAGGGELLQSTR